MAQRETVKESFKSTVDAYKGLHEQQDVDARLSNYTTLVNQYYDLATDFYEIGWGQHFHFAPRWQWEGFKASLLRHERHLDRSLRLAPGKRVLDVGCGVGGPARHIAKRSGASIVGINNNGYQVARAERYAKRDKLDHLVSFTKADFMELPFEDASFDAVYTIEASCHAPDRVKLFSGLNRVMKPGALFAGYEWCLTDRYDAKNPEHQKIKKDIEIGNGLPDLTHTSVVDDALRAAGFEILQTEDMASHGSPETPWYLPLTGEEKGLLALPRKPLGRVITNKLTRFLEQVKLAPKGTSDVSGFLNQGADALVAGGKTGTFTPMYFFLVRKKA